MLKNFYAVIFILLLMPTTWAQETEPIANSGLTGAKLPANASRLSQQSVPAEISRVLRELVEAGGEKVRQGDSETLVWAGGNYRKSNASNLVQKVTGDLQTSGWTYEVGGRSGDLTIFTLLKSAPTRRAVLGFYTASDDALVLAWTEMLPADSNGERGVKRSGNKTSGKTFDDETRSPNNNSLATVLNVEKTADYVNVMGNEMPALPKFPALQAKAGKVRGYVKDASGKPLAGAAIGVRSTYIGGAYSGAQGTTDANGYYEFAIPKGVAHYYNAGYAIEYGDGLAAMSLHPADGKIESFASVDGAVENFVLLSYGITSRESLIENPQLASTYYGGAISLGYGTRTENDCCVPKTYLLENSEIEITLTPEGETLDGGAGKSFVIRKKIFTSVFKINNIPIGRYKISAKTGDGKPLKMSLNAPRQSVFGMTPAETTGSASVLFYPNGAKASMATPNFGNWNAVEISVEMP